MLTFPDYPLSKGSGPATRTDISEKQLGDGYVQTAAGLPDNLLLRFSMRFNARPLADINAIETFLREHGGWTPFLFAVQGEDAARVWRCEEWSTERISADVRSLNATLLEIA